MLTAEGQHHSQWVHYYYIALSRLGLPDHKVSASLKHVISHHVKLVHSDLYLNNRFFNFFGKGGLILLLLVLLCKIAHKNISRTLAVEIGGEPWGVWHTIGSMGSAVLAFFITRNTVFLLNACSFDCQVENDLRLFPVVYLQ